MASRVLILLGTNKGAFVLQGDERRSDWTIRGPYCDHWPIHHVIADPRTQTIYAGGGNGWTGAGVWKSEDLGNSWTQSGEGLSYGDGEAPVTSVWSLAPTNGRLLAGVEPAGLFESRDDGASFTHVAGLRDHPSRPQWQSGGGGMMVHSIVPDPTDKDRTWVGISVAGVFCSEDGRKTWTARNRGTRADYNPEEDRYPEYGQCVHCLVRAPGERPLLYQQNHCGMYRSDDGGLNWQSIEDGLPSSFGFPAAPHPRDPDTLFLVPLNGDTEGRYVPDGKAAVWRTRDGGRNWTALRKGLPQENAYLCILRQALTTDTLEPAGVYFGTNSGSLFASSDEGESWSLIAQHLPIIFSVETMVVDA
ncbi:exo-alpha-sialidase [Stappia sp. GBMRC 2046]|uniref:Exo-alpha-sialidase n=1 Tax=Stappia sediminis TaxID=2692190 RepID=A0A7X3LVF2_9HYPH|nr:exo-alpha-sialidase [Stappia sediminis]MXN65855.1 exo-alpha-sialidase [Stappia sediminis]